MNREQLKDLLDKKAHLYNNHQFIESDPIQIPHRFTKKEDIEISALLTAVIAWGQRKNIIKSALHLMDLMDNSPYEYIVKSPGFNTTRHFVYRTFQPIDLLFFLCALKNIYIVNGGLEQVFVKGFNDSKSVFGAIMHFRKVFLETEHLRRSEKHLSNISANSSGKRINLFLRWMVRSDDRGVDFGIWKQIPASSLMLPLDLHVGNVARKLGILSRQQNDWKAVEEATAFLRKFDANDPIKYDYALFGMGVFENFK